MNSLEPVGLLYIIVCCQLNTGSSWTAVCGLPARCDGGLSACGCCGGRGRLASSRREALNLSGEHEYLVPPLALPDAPDVPVSDLMVVDSVDLFVQRARKVSHRFAITEENGADIARICMRLDGLPLAIELAVARVKLFGPQQILERLIDRFGLLVGGPRDMPQRQRTRAAAWER